MADFLRSVENAVHIVLTQGETYIDGIHLGDGDDGFALGDVVAFALGKATDAAINLSQNAAILEVFAGSCKFCLCTGAAGLQFLHGGLGGFHVLAGGCLLGGQCGKALVAAGGVDNLGIELGYGSLCLFHGSRVAQRVNFQQQIAFPHHGAFLEMHLDHVAFHSGADCHMAHSFSAPDALTDNLVLSRNGFLSLYIGDHLARHLGGCCSTQQQGNCKQ